MEAACEFEWDFPDNDSDRVRTDHKLSSAWPTIHYWSFQLLALVNFYLICDDDDDNNDDANADDNDNDDHYDADDDGKNA